MARLVKEAERAGKLAIANAVHEHLVQTGLRKKSLQGPGLSEGTLTNFFKGEFHDDTLTRIENKLGTTFSTEKDAPPDASDEMGGYSFHEVEDLQGTYLYVRPLFRDPQTLNAYLVDIRWDNTRPCLTFRERERADSKYAQEGVVYSKKKDPFLHLLSVRLGDVRNVLVQVPDNEGVARGLVLTTHHVRGAQFVPVATQCFLRRLNNEERPATGFIKKDDAAYDEYLRILRSVSTEDLGRLIPVA